MQQFRVVLTVTANTTETVSAAEVREALVEQLEWDGGGVEVEEVEELP